MRKFAEAYGDFTIMDATHNTTRYTLKLIPTTNVDCLGHNVITGCGLDVSENSTFLGEMLDKLGLSKVGATLMTDGASAYPEVAEIRSMKHLLCVHHFQVHVACGNFLSFHCCDFS